MYFDQTMGDLGIFGIGRKLKKTTKKIGKAIRKTAPIFAPVTALSLRPKQTVRTAAMVGRAGMSAATRIADKTKWLSPGQFLTRSMMGRGRPRSAEPMNIQVPDLYGGMQPSQMLPPAAMPATNYPVPYQESQVYPDQAEVPIQAMTYAGEENVPPTADAPAPEKKSKAVPIALALLAAKLMLF